MIYDILYENLRKRLNRLTPLPFDCGRLCGGACCTGDSDTGMYLFPFEEQFYKGKRGFKIFDSELLMQNGTPIKIISCTASCLRSLRPVSCRIFPLFPYFKKGSVPKAIIDPRAKGVCPITYPESSRYIQPSFYREVELFGRFLAKTEQGANFLESVSFVLDDYMKLQN